MPKLQQGQSQQYPDLEQSLYRQVHGAERQVRGLVGALSAGLNLPLYSSRSADKENQHISRDASGSAPNRTNYGSAEYVACT